MKYQGGNRNVRKLSSAKMKRSDLLADCEKCFGFCCVALYFSVSDGFPADKEAGKPCLNLQSDFRCRVHKNLAYMGFKGCTAYDCLGAGQKVAQVTYGGHDWRQEPEFARQMFDCFLIMKQLHEMLWYLIEVQELQADAGNQDEIVFIINSTESLTYLNAEALINLDLAGHRAAVNALLQHTSELVRNKVRSERKTTARYRKTFGHGLDFIGADLRKLDLRGENLCGAYLIAADLRGVDLTGADLIGADLRDADLRGADLTNSIFLTQAQVNTAKGNSDTKLPRALFRPVHW